ncbi:hypothetical protein GCM10010201_13350 [Pilimelia columellifera subsp. columellifera]|uniref:GGDEF domain-containing protein n=2 Tax=Pilimelia TaxID=53370 RepID=A0ABP6AKQ5_9ACTN
MFADIRNTGSPFPPPILMLSEGPVNRLECITAGIDLIYPLDDFRLALTHLSHFIQRRDSLLDLSPSTELPGTLVFPGRARGYVNRGKAFAIAYADIDRMKPFSDTYGPIRAGELIRTLSSTFVEAIQASPGKADAFHIGGDDFLMLCDADDVVTLCRHVVLEFEIRADKLYDPVDARRGYVELTDQRGRLHKAALVTLSIGVSPHFPQDPWILDRAIAVACEMKGVAKGQPGSYIAIDNRHKRRNWFTNDYH